MPAATIYTSDYITGAHNLARNTRTDFVDSVKPVEWFALYDAYKACDWDFKPCQWSRRQVQEAVAKGLVPEWDESERPIYPDARKKFERTVK